MNAGCPCLNLGYTEQDWVNALSRGELPPDIEPSKWSQFWGWLQSVDWVAAARESRQVYDVIRGRYATPDELDAYRDWQTRAGIPDAQKPWWSNPLVILGGGVLVVWLATRK